jgi:hypothetical protein
LDAGSTPSVFTLANSPHGSRPLSVLSFPAAGPNTNKPIVRTSKETIAYLYRTAPGWVRFVMFGRDNFLGDVSRLKRGLWLNGTEVYRRMAQESLNHLYRIHVRVNPTLPLERRKTLEPGEPRLAKCIQGLTLYPRPQS